MRKHTPGPWVKRREGWSTIYIESRIRPGVLQEVAACWPTEAGKEEQEANARLIAAAPETAAERDRLKEINAELLHAIETLLGETDDSYYMLQAERESVARAAIYKAKDRTEQKENQQ